jgi:2-alkenal reductase
MTMLNDLKKLLVSGLTALTLVAAVACSGDASPTATNVVVEPKSEQVAVSDSSESQPVGTAAIDRLEVEISDGPADSLTSGAPGKNADIAGNSIPAAFDGDPDDAPIGDAVPEVASPEPEVIELTAADIVAAQEEHLAELYETTVQSVVFIVTGTIQGVGSGSGFVWDEDGHIVTNYHVIQGANELVVKFFNGREYRADIVAFDPAADLAVIKLIDVEHELVPIAIGNSSELRPGETAIALGNPFGEEFTMTTGIVSAVTRTLDSGFSSYSIPSVIQTDAAINPGNSGGPLLDMNGAVIGVNTQIKSETRQSSGVGFAVPVDLVKRVVPSLIEFGQHTYPLMGISGNEVNLSLRENVGLAGDVVGAYVTSVTPGGPADNAGIRGDSGTQFSGLNYDGDVIVSINSVRMNSMDDLIGYLALNTEPGEEIVVGVARDGVEIAISMTLGARAGVS